MEADSKVIDLKQDTGGKRWYFQEEARLRVAPRVNKDEKPSMRVWHNNGDAATSSPSQLETLSAFLVLYLLTLIRKHYLKLTVACQP